jgi:hypothetical protein
MNFFDEAALRLKQQLKVTENKQVAEALGMTGNAWTMRKRRGAFPETELRALAQQRPELGIDVEYVLTGGVLSTLQRATLRNERDKLRADPTTPGEKQDAGEFLDILALSIAQDNKRAPIYKRIIDVLRPCADETLELALKLVTKLAMAEQAEESEAEESKKAESWLKKEEARQIGPPSN